MNRQDFHYTQCGLDYVYLGSGVTFKERDGEVYFKIKNVDDLHALIAEKIVTSSSAMLGQEVTFLRSLMRMTQAGMAGMFGKKRNSIAQLETADARNKPITCAMSKSIRMLYLLHLNSPDLTARANDILSTQEEERINKELELNFNSGWTVNYAA